MGSVRRSRGIVSGSPQLQGRRHAHKTKPADMLLSFSAVSARNFGDRSSPGGPPEHQRHPSVIGEEAGGGERFVDRYAAGDERFERGGAGLHVERVAVEPQLHGGVEAGGEFVFEEAGEGPDGAHVPAALGGAVGDEPHEVAVHALKRSQF